jgi:hypothetical protein
MPRMKSRKKRPTRPQHEAAQQFAVSALCCRTSCAFMELVRNMATLAAYVRTVAPNPASQARYVVECIAGVDGVMIYCPFEIAL